MYYARRLCPPWIDGSIGDRLALACSAPPLPTVSGLQTRITSGGSVTADTVKKVQAAAKKLDGAQQKFGDLYVKAAEKVLAKGAGYVPTEMERLAKLIDGGSITPDRKAAFLLKMNVLKAFKGEPATEAPDEL